MVAHSQRTMNPLRPGLRYFPDQLCLLRQHVNFHHYNRCFLLQSLLLLQLHLEYMGNMNFLLFRHLLQSKMQMKSYLQMLQELCIDDHLVDHWYRQKEPQSLHLLQLCYMIVVLKINYLSELLHLRLQNKCQRYCSTIDIPCIGKDNTLRFS